MPACGNRQRQSLFLILLTTLCLRLPLTIFVPLQEEGYILRFTWEWHRSQTEQESLVMLEERLDLLDRT